MTSSRTKRPKRVSNGVYTHGGFHIDWHIGFGTIARKRGMFEWWEIRELPEAGRFTRLRQAVEFIDKR